MIFKMFPILTISSKDIQNQQFIFGPNTKWLGITKENLNRSFKAQPVIPTIKKMGKWEQLKKIFELE